MSATVTRPASNDLDQRRLAIAMGALILAVSLLVAATVFRQVAFESPAAPAVVPAAVAHDHGWLQSTQTGLTYTGIPYQPTYPGAEPRFLNPGEIIVNGMTPSETVKSSHERFPR